MVAGNLLNTVINSKNKKNFTEYIMWYECVVFSRTSPK